MIGVLRMPAAIGAAAVLALTAGCASAGPSRTASGSGLQVGVSAIDITPEEPIRLTGYGSRTTPTADVRQRLWAKALAFSDGGRRPSVLITA